MNEEIINEINKILEAGRMTKKGIYEQLLINKEIKPNSDKIVYSIIDYGLKNNLINNNKIITFKSKKGKIPEIFTIEHIIKLFDEVESPKLAIVIWLGFFCGLRIKEVCNIKLNDLNLITKTIFIRNSKNTNRTKEGYGKDRIVNIPDIAINPIKKWLDIIQGGEWLIPSMQNENRPIRTKTIHEQFRKLLEQSNLSKPEYTTHFKGKNYGRKKELKRTTYIYKFHTLRHTYATYLLEKGVPLENIQKSLGHNDLNTTLIYCKVKDSKTKDFINNAFNMPMKLINKDSQLNQYKPNNQNQENYKFINSEEILKQRLAKGEIDIITYKRLLAEISPDNTINIIFEKEKNK